jgi:hypothetical protein
MPKRTSENLYSIFLAFIAVMEDDAMKITTLPLPSPPSPAA